MKSKLVFLIILLAIGGVFLMRSCRSGPITNANPSGQNIIAFGDSLTAGTGLGPGEDSFARLLEREFGVTILNAGVPGNTTADGLARLRRDVLDRNPKVVLLGLGGNDLLRRGSREEARQNLSTMIQQIHATGAGVVLIGVDGPLGMGGMSGVYRDLAREHGTAYVPNILRGIYGKPDLMADQVHPNAQGHAIMARRIAKELRKSFPSLFR